MHKSPIVLSLLGGIVVVLAGVIGFVVVPNIVEDQIEKELRLVRGTDVWNRWSEIESPVYINFYVYNVTNADDVENGKQPILQELGPYAYRERRQKVNLHSVTCKETVNYEQKITYFFDQEKSGRFREDDIVNIVNVAFISVLKVATSKFIEEGYPADQAEFAAATIAYALRETETVVRRNVTAGEVIFTGYDVSGLKVVGGIENYLTPEFDGFRFGIWKGKNESTDGLYEVYTGTTGADKFGIIKQWNGSPSVNYWNSAECNRLGGSDGTIFPPFIEKEDDITIFNSDLCRTLTLSFKEEVTVKDIKAYRFTPPTHILKNPVENPDNMCYCLKENRTECQSGTFDISPCRYGAPISLSLPYFLDGYEPFATAMGMNKPNRALHETTIDIEPRTGMLLGAHARFQVNVEVRTLPLAPQFENITQNMLFPVLWLDEEGSICDYDVDDYKSRVEKPIKIINIARWTVLGIGIALIFCAILLYVGLSRKQRFARVTKNVE